MQDSGYGAMAGVMCIPLVRKGEVKGWAIADEADRAKIADHKWFLSPYGYALTPVSGGKWKQMHRLLLDAPAGINVDHINGVKLDNRRSNLRFATQAQNAQNQKARGGSSKYRGVCWNKDRGKWKATVGLNGKTCNLGLYDDELEAARVAAEFRATHMPFSEEAA